MKKLLFLVLFSFALPMFADECMDHPEWCGEAAQGLRPAGSNLRL